MPPPGDDVWFNRPYPRFVGETVWLVSPNHESLPLAVDRLDRDLQAWRDEAALNARIEAGEKFWPVQRYQRQHRTAGYVLAASGAPSAPTAQLARIDQIYQNFSADLTLLDMETMEFASEQLQRVRYGQMRSIMPSVRRLELCGPDLTMPARDAAMAELDRLHSTQNRAASHIRDSRKVGRCLPIELKCGCVGVYPIRDSGINERQRVVCRVGPWVPTLEQSQFWPFVESIEHDQSGRCPIGKFMDAAIDARIDSAGQQSEGRPGLKKSAASSKQVNTRWTTWLISSRRFRATLGSSASSAPSQICTIIRGDLKSVKQQRENVLFRFVV